MNPGLKREPWDRTRLDEDWNVDDPPPRKPANVERLRQRHTEFAETFPFTGAPHPSSGVDLQHGPITPPLKPTPIASEGERRNVASVPPTVEKSPNISRVELFWQTRPCWICSKVGPCEHRESFADWAL
jgi:hypothetical protein